ncbi:cell division protein ZapC domain-containing protein [Ferrimonas marina]|nr:cell division protein ZapC domain-containing protein [Ferrimonas marina]
MPEQSWNWFYHQEEQKLAIALGQELVFVTPYGPKQLTPDSLDGQGFTASHADYYQSVLQELSRYLSVSEAALVQIALNLTAAHFFALPMMPKSWHFKSSDRIAYGRSGTVVELCTDTQRQSFVVVEAGDQSSLLMLLGPDCSLSNKRSMDQFDLIKVMNDRLIPIAKRSQARVVAA